MLLSTLKMSLLAVQFSIFSAQDPQWEAFPNPVQDVLTVRSITSTDGATRLKLTDLTGRVVWEEQAQEGFSGTLQVDLTGQPAGYYFLKAESLQGVTTLRIYKE